MARGKGNGTLQKRGKYWLAIWVVDGKRFTRSTRESDRRKAEKRLEEFTRPFRERSELAVIENLQAKVRVKKAELKELEEKESKPVSMKLALDAYYSDLEVNQVVDSTDEQYSSMVKKLAEDTGIEYAYELTDKAVDGFMAGVKKKFCASTYNRYLVFLRRLWDVLSRHDPRIKANPFERLRKLKAPSASNRRELSDEEVKTLVMKASERSRDLYCLFITAALTGMRKSDVVDLRWSSFKDGYIEYLPIKTRKNGRLACVPVHPKLMEVLEAERGKDPVYVFPGLRRMHRSLLEWHVKEVFKSAGVETSERGADGKVRIITGFHALRVFFVSHCARAGMPVNQIMKMAGHSRPDMSLHYTRTRVDDLKLPFGDERPTETITISRELFDRLESRRGRMSLEEYLRSLTD